MKLDESLFEDVELKEGFEDDYNNCFVEFCDGKPQFAYNRYSDASRGMLYSKAGDSQYDMGIHEYVIKYLKDGTYYDVDDNGNPVGLDESLTEEFSFGEEDGLFIIYLDGQIYMQYPSKEIAEEDGWILTPNDSLFFTAKDNRLIAKNLVLVNNLKFTYDKNATPNPSYDCYYFNCETVNTGRINSFSGRLSIYVNDELRYPYHDTDNENTVISFSFGNEKIPFYTVPISTYLSNPNQHDLIVVDKFYEKLRGKNESLKEDFDEEECLQEQSKFRSFNNWIKVFLKSHTFGSADDMISYLEEYDMIDELEDEFQTDVCGAIEEYFEELKNSFDESLTEEFADLNDIKIIVRDVIDNFKEITGIDIKAVYNPIKDIDSSIFDQDVIDMTYPLIDEYVSDKYDLDGREREELLYALDDELTSRISLYDESLKEDLTFNNKEVELIKKYLEKELGHTWTDRDDEKQIRLILNKIHNKDKALKEDFDEVVAIEVPDVIADIKEDELTPSGPAIGEDTGIADLLLNLINGENDTIRDYNTFKANLDSHPEFISVIDDIANEENNHVGMLQTLLKQISPNVETIKQGEAEAEKDLFDDDSQSFEVPDFEVDDSFDDGFGGIYA